MKKTVLITGAAKGIGASLARVFAQNSYKVALHYNKSAEKAEALCKLLCDNGCEAFLFRCDLGVEGAPKKLVDEVISKLGRIDVLINNAAVAQTAPFVEIGDREGAEVLNINLLSAIECAKYASLDMLKRKSGKIINISSVWGICGAACEVYYSASKAGINGFTKALSKELAPSGIQVNAIAPGVVETDMLNNLSQEEKENLKQEIPAARFASGYEIAKTALFLASHDADYITGQIINVSGGFLI